MQPGYSYNYNMIINVDTVTFDNVVIAPWTEVDVNDTPIIP